MAGCKMGTIKRVAYHRKGYTRKNGTRVKSAEVGASCIKNTGEAGKWTTRHKTRGIGTLKKGRLTRLGYSSKLYKGARHAALNRAIKAYGPLAVYRMLQAVATYAKRTSPNKAAIYRSDRNWVGAKHGYKH